MILITYDPCSSLEGATWADGDIPDLLARLREQARASNRDVHATVANELVILAIRHAVVTGAMDGDSIRFIFNNQILQMNDIGQVIDPPEGFCTTTDILLHQIVKAQAERRRG